MRQSQRGHMYANRPSAHLPTIRDATMQARTSIFINRILRLHSVHCLVCTPPAARGQTKIKRKEQMKENTYTAL